MGSKDFKTANIESLGAHSDFGRSVNPISTRGGRLWPPNYYWHPRIFRPSDGPETPS